MHPSTSNIGARLKTEKGVKPQAATANTYKGPAIDRLGFGSCVLQGSNGDASGAPTTQSVTHKLQHSDTTTDGDFVDFTGGAAAAQTANDKVVEVDIDLAGAKRYIRAVAVVAFTGGTSPAIPVASVITLGGSATNPV